MEKEGYPFEGFHLGCKLLNGFFDLIYFVCLLVELFAEGFLLLVNGSLRFFDLGGTSCMFWNGRDMLIRVLYISIDEYLGIQFIVRYMHIEINMRMER